ncbi:uncharacterized protein LOC142527981 isoform X4 [Primulina tabacum]|uniref:uncharacterized protein LOC142527981 isoform X4 n=1 Tax=Primulina tabacum TaxID=48773 RepID=UPI003F59C904
MGRKASSSYSKRPGDGHSQGERVEVKETALQQIWVKGQSLTMEACKSFFPAMPSLKRVEADKMRDGNRDVEVYG